MTNTLLSNGSQAIFIDKPGRLGISLLWMCSIWVISICYTDAKLSIAQDSRNGRTADGSEEWGYVEVRKGAHMFWWLYKSPNEDRASSASSWPLVLWLQGGPGASGVGVGNFGEFGPLTTALLPRQYTWLRKADLLFVDSPVGAGFSYVDNSTLLLSKDEDVANDLVTFLGAFFYNHASFQHTPIYIFAESYGGKHATLLGLALHQAIQNGLVKATLGGVALGDSWISPVDFVNSWGPVLKQFSRIDETQVELLDKEAKAIQAQVDDGQYLDATRDWSYMENLVSNLSNNVDFYNVLLDQSQSSVLLAATDSKQAHTFFKFGEHLEKLNRMKGEVQVQMDLTSLMNGPIRKKLQIIPSSVIWFEISQSVFHALGNDFMKDVIARVDELLSTGINVTIYSGQVDLICATQGTETWVKKLKWSGLEMFQNAERVPLYCNASGPTGAFFKSYKNLSFFWILRAGHMVPADNPCIALDMLDMVTRR